MRRVAPVFAVLILCILGGMGSSYYSRLVEQARTSPRKPAALPPGLNAAAHEWSYTETKGGQPHAWVKAKDFSETNGKYDLVGVELHLFHDDGKNYDQVTSAKASFDIAKGILFSDGNVEMTMDVPADEGPNPRLMTIKSSGVYFETKTGKAYTDRPASFHFDRGEGKSVGATYDPNTRELFMKSKVELVWTGSDASTKPMKVESEQVTYKERESKIYLAPWSKLTRETLALNAGPAVVTLENKNIKLVETSNAQGTDNRPGRNLEYAADRLAMDFDEAGEIQKITGVDHARLVSAAETAVTTMTSDRVDLSFDTANGDSILQTALARGHAVAESKPVPKPGSDMPQTRILRSEVIKTAMRSGGQEIESVETEAPGALEFVPNRPDQAHRWMNGDRIWIKYGPQNQIQTARSINVSTRTENPRSKASPESDAPALTWSKDLLATFQPNSSDIQQLEQWNDFRYEQGERRARAQRAVLEQAENVITLFNTARVWDATGAAEADKIILDQKSGDFTAEGNVNSTRMPDPKDDQEDSGMLSQDEPLHAKAKRMVTTDHNQKIRYEGNAVLWQGANRLEADIVEIDRETGDLKAHGRVVSQLLDKAKDDTGNKPGTTTKPQRSVFTIVKAPDLTYNDDDRLAHYTGGVVLTRPNMQVKAQEIRAFLRDDSDDSSLDHAFADGKVQIFQSSMGRTRNGSSEHAEYYVDEDKVILEGGQPEFIDSLRGTTHGRRLTWFSKDDRLVVDGAEKEPAKSVLRRKNTAK